MNTTVSHSGMSILNKIIGRRIKSITPEDWRDFNRSYGNIKVELEDFCIVIENDYRNVTYFEGKEELAGYDVLQLLSCNNFHASVMPDKLIKVEINQEIQAIKVVRDTIKIYDYKSDKIDCYTIDQAIIFEFEDRKWLFSQISLFTPLSKMVFSNSIESEIKSLDVVKEEWADDSKEGDNKYDVSVERELINVSDI